MESIPYTTTMRFSVARHVHSSWQIAVACVGVVIGAAVVSSVQAVWLVSAAWLVAGITLVIIGCVRQQEWTLLLVLCGGAMIGGWRSSVEMMALDNYKNLYGHEIELTGTIREDVTTDKKGNVVLRLQNVKVNSHALAGKIWVTSTGNVATLQRSDVVTLRGKIQPGFGSFAATMYRANVVHAERAPENDPALQVRNWFAEKVHIALPGNTEASLGLGFVLGQNRSLPPDLASALQVAGLTHIVVASGYNLTILVRLVRRLFAKVSKYLSAILSGGLIVSFVAITGLSPSMSRAGFVAGICILAWYYGRKFHPAVILPFAAAVTILFDPSFVRGDVGWQLSFAAFAGVMLLAPLLQAYYFGSKKPGLLRQILGESIAAWLCTLPILLITFGTMSNVAILANLLIVPLIPLAMLLVFVAGLAAIVAPATAQIVGLPASWLLGYMVHVAEWFAGLDWAQTKVDVQWWQIALIYIAIIGFGVWMWRATKLNLRDQSIVE